MAHLRVYVRPFLGEKYACGLSLLWFTGDYSATTVNISEKPVVSIFFGKGDYMGYRMITFEIKPAENVAEGE